MTGYDETRCYGVVGTARSGPQYCGSPAKRKDANGRPMCGRCRDIPGISWWGARYRYPEGTGGKWEFLRNPSAPKPLAATVKAVNTVLKDAGVRYGDPYRSGLKVRQRYDGTIAVETWVPLGGVRLGATEWELKFEKARGALAARGLDLVMVDDRHATVTEAKL